MEGDIVLEPHRLSLISNLRFRLVENNTAKPDSKVSFYPKWQHLNVQTSTYHLFTENLLIQFGLQESLILCAFLKAFMDSG